MHSIPDGVSLRVQQMHGPWAAQVSVVGFVAPGFHSFFSRVDFPKEQLEKAVCAIEMVAEQEVLLVRVKVESRCTLVHMVL